MIKYSVLFILFLLAIGFSPAQAQRYTISGYVRDSATHESMVGANVYDLKTFKGTSANNYGFYSLTLDSDTVKITFSYVGYQGQALSFYLDKDTIINADLVAGQLLDNVVIEADLATNNPELTQMSTINIAVEDIRSMPSLLGETDIIKVIQLLPGVQSGAEGTSGLYVRGGGPDQNLILLDGVPVYNASHLFGFFSVFNADAINDVELIKGGFPARYGGRLSSVLDITMKEGNNQKIQGTGSIGLISSKLTLEGPLKRDKSSFIISARRTYADLLIKPITKAVANGEMMGYYFYDLNAKANYIFSANDRLYLSLYSGKDEAYSDYEDFYYENDLRYDTKDESGLYWGNLTTALRWNHLFTPKLFSNTTLTFSRYAFNIYNSFHREVSGVQNRTDIYQRKYGSGIQDYGAKIDMEYFPTPDQSIKFGVSGIHHTFTPGAYAIKSNVEVDTTFGSTPVNAMELDTYIEDDITITKRLKANLGIHGSTFIVQDTGYFSLQPRAALRFMFDDKSSIKASYSQMTQYIHLLTNSGIGLPTDLWVPSLKTIAPQWSEQSALGYSRGFNHSFELTVEGFYKRMRNLIEYQEGSSFLNSTDDWHEKITAGNGTSRGVEVFLQRKTGLVNGWIGYTWSNTTRQFAALNEGRPYPYKYDRTHDVSIVLNTKPREDLEVSAVWVYGTGNAITLPRVKYPGDPNSVFFTNRYNAGNPQKIIDYGDRNSFRVPAYHRMDINLTWYKDTRWGERAWSFGVYNVYNRKNPFYVTLGEDNKGRPKFIQHSLFPFIPSVKYSFKF